MGAHPPVTDWAADWDHTDPAYNRDPYPIWDDLRERCPVAHTDRYGGAWLPVRHEDVSAIAYDTDHFTSRGVVVSEDRPTELDLPAPIGPAPPITSDPPFHAMARRLLLPPFSPKAIAALEGFARETCDELLDAIAARADGTGVIDADAAIEFAQHIPVRVIAKMLGYPVSDADLFRRFIKVTLEDVDLPLVERQERFDEMEVYLDLRIAEHLADPQDDLTTYLLEAELDGQKLIPEHVRGTIVLLMVAGIDTTWSAIGSALWHLASHTDDRRRLLEEPEITQLAIEELLRAFAPVTMARLVAEEVEIGGQTLKPGDWTLLPFPAATGIRSASSAPTRWSSTAPSTAMRPSGSGSTAASAPTWPAWSSRWPSSRGSPTSPTTSWRILRRSSGPPARCAAPARSPCASTGSGAPGGRWTVPGRSATVVVGRSHAARVPPSPPTVVAGRSHAARVPRSPPTVVAGRSNAAQSGTVADSGGWAGPAPPGSHGPRRPWWLGGLTPPLHHRAAVAAPAHMAHPGSPAAGCRRCRKAVY